jgi:hypothetical protein
VRSMFERGADVVDGRLSGFDVEGGGFEHDVGLSRVEPGVVVLALLAEQFRECIRALCAQETGHIKAGRVYLPADAPRSDARDAPLDAVAFAQFGVLASQEFDQRPIDVAEAEQADGKGFHECDGEYNKRMFLLSETSDGRS